MHSRRGSWNPRPPLLCGEGGSPELLQPPSAGLPRPVLEGEVLSWDGAAATLANAQGTQGPTDMQVDSMLSKSSTTATRANSAPLGDNMGCHTADPLASLMLPEHSFLPSPTTLDPLPASHTKPVQHFWHCSQQPGSDFTGLSPPLTSPSNMTATNTHAFASPIGPATPKPHQSLSALDGTSEIDILQALSTQPKALHRHSRSMPADLMDAAFDSWLPDLPQEDDPDQIPAHRFAAEACSPVDPLACLQVAPGLVRSNSCLEMLHALLEPRENVRMVTPRDSPSKGQLSDAALADMLLGDPAFNRPAAFTVSEDPTQLPFAMEPHLSPELLHWDPQEVARPQSCFLPLDCLSTGTSLHGSASGPPQLGRLDHSSASSSDQTPSAVQPWAPLLPALSLPADSTCMMNQPADSALHPLPSASSDLPAFSLAAAPATKAKPKRGRPKSTANASTSCAAPVSMPALPPSCSLDVAEPAISIKEEFKLVLFGKDESAASEGPIRQSHRRHTPPKWASDSFGEDDPCIKALHGSRSLPSDSMLLEAQRNKPGRKRLAVDHINLELLQEHGYFDMPIQEAAQQLKVGLSVLKRICRQMGLARWPYRTRQSLRGVIAKTEQYYRGEGTGTGVQKEHVMQALQTTLDSLKGVPGQGLSDSVRKYRQSVFKLNYKIKKRKAAPEQDQDQPEVLEVMPVIPSTAVARMAVSDGLSEEQQSDDAEWVAQAPSEAGSPAMQCLTSAQSSLLRGVLPAAVHGLGSSSEEQAMPSLEELLASEDASANKPPADVGYAMQIEHDILVKQEQF